MTTQEFRERYQRNGTFTFRNSAQAKPQKLAYKAFSTERQRQIHLWIRPNDANEETEFSIPYSCLSKPMYCDGGGFHISIFVNDDSILQVEIQGRCLGPHKGDISPDGEDALHDLWRKLLKNEVIYIQEFDPRKWDMPPDGEAVVLAIKVYRKPQPNKPDDEMLPGERKIVGATRKH
jgi:hypothetical protein